MEEEEEEDDFFDGVVTDIEFDVEEMDVDIDGELGNEEEGWLTDGSVFSEEDLISRSDFSREPGEFCFCFFEYKYVLINYVYRIRNYLYG